MITGLLTSILAKTYSGQRKPIGIFPTIFVSKAFWNKNANPLALGFSLRSHKPPPTGSEATSPANRPPTELSHIQVPYPSDKQGAFTVPRGANTPIYHEYESRTLPTLPRNSGRPRQRLDRAGADDGQGDEVDKGAVGTVTASSSFETVRSDHVYETAYAMQQLQQQYLQSLQRQQRTTEGEQAGDAAIRGLGELTVAQIVELHMAAKDLPTSTQPLDVQARY